MIKFDMKSNIVLHDQDRIAGSVELILHDCSFEEYNILISELRELESKVKVKDYAERDLGMVVK
jgi:hypothetical protein